MKTMTIVAVAFLAGSLLAGCAKQPMDLVRMDGQEWRGNPILAQQANVDRTVCIGDTQKANLSGVTVSGGGFAGAIAQSNRDRAADDVFNGCMAQKGYAVVPATQSTNASEYFRRLQDQRVAQAKSGVVTSSTTTP